MRRNSIPKFLKALPIISVMSLLLGLISPNSAMAAYTFTNITSTSFTIGFNTSYGPNDTWQCLVYNSGGTTVIGNYSGIAGSVHSVTATGLQPSTTYLVECSDLTTLTNYEFGTTVQTLGPAPDFTLSTSSETATVGQALTAGYAINSIGGAITSYSISSAPGHGLSFSTVTGFITGTPTSAMTATDFVITGTNGSGSDTATITLTILPAQVPIVIAPANSQQISGTVGTAFSFNFNISGGVTPYTVAISSGTLPAGLSMTTGGQISGTPTAAGNATLSFTVEDAISTQASAVTGVVFAISAASAPTPARVEVPAPTQQSKIVKISPETGTALETTSVVASGTFIEKITSIQVNGVPLPAGSWKETTTAITFVVPVLAAGKYSIQIYNGSAPLLAAQSFVVPGSAALVANPLKRTSIVCTIGKHSRTFFGLKPVCPAGYTKK